MPAAPRGGVATWWTTWGEGAPDVLMLHCSLAHSGAWDGLASRLAGCCLAFDAPGHGRSGPRDAALDYHLQCTQVARAFLPDRPVDVIGHSFGATVALRLALEQPGRVRRLVLIEPVLFAAARGTPAFERHATDMKPFVAAMAHGDRFAAAELFTAMWGTGVAWSEMRDGERRGIAERIDIIPAQQASLYEDNAGMLAAGRLEALDLPVLLLEGAASPPIIAAIHDAMQMRLPDVRREVIAGAGHMAPITHPRAVAEVAGPFLSP